jgi:hypothetical protein
MIWCARADIKQWPFSPHSVRIITNRHKTVEREIYTDVVINIGPTYLIGPINGALQLKLQATQH